MKIKLTFLAIAFALAVPAAIPVMAGPYVSPRSKLSTISSRAKQMWVVGYVNAGVEESARDLIAARDNGADAIIFESGNYAKLDKTLAEMKSRFPDFPIGANFLGDKYHLYSFEDTFALVKKHGLAIAWTDFSGVDLIKEAKPVSLHAIETSRPTSAFYCSGIHMKYSTLIDKSKAIETSALQAMGWVEGIVMTGAKTGDPTDPVNLKRVRSVVGDYPLGAASGVTADNVGSILPYVDFILVNTGVSDEKHRLVGEKVRALRQAMGE